TQPVCNELHCPPCEGSQGSKFLSGWLHGSQPLLRLDHHIINTYSVPAGVKFERRCRSSDIRRRIPSLKCWYEVWRFYRHWIDTFFVLIQVRRRKKLDWNMRLMCSCG